MSQHIDQTNVDLAERDVFDNYIAPLSSSFEFNNQGENVKDALMCLTNLLVLQRSTFATRAGAKEKTSAQSMTANRWSLLEEWAEPCKAKLMVVAKSVGVRPWGLVNDICGIYYGKHFLGV